MFADLDYSHPEVREDVKNWGPWVAHELKLKGFRFDAIKHFSEEFLLEFIQNLDAHVGEGWFLVGEFCRQPILLSSFSCAYLSRENLASRIAELSEQDESQVFALRRTSCRKIS